MKSHILLGGVISNFCRKSTLKFNKMDYFKTIKMNLAMCLYYPNQDHIFNVKRLRVIFAAFLVVLSYFAFLFYDAHSKTEYVTSGFMTVSALGIFISFIDTTFKTKTIFKLIDTDIGEIIEKSESTRNLFRLDLVSSFLRNIKIN